jgi:hypothetical protein
MTLLRTSACKGSLMLCRVCSWETPGGRCDEHNSKFFLSKKPRFIDQ